MDIKELQKRGEQYFKEGRDYMYATEDGNFFYPEHKSYALNHERNTGSKLHKVEPATKTGSTKKESKPEKKEAKSVQAPKPSNEEKATQNKSE